MYPDDAGEYEAPLRRLLERIPDGWGPWISCGPGWYPILARIEERLSDLDPDYGVNQIKEKFGTLRFYWEGDILDGDAIVDEAEAESARTCELCGSHGSLRTKAGWLAEDSVRRLCDDEGIQRSANQEVTKQTRRPNALGRYLKFRPYLTKS